jgi:hypothetical protein
MIKFYIEYGKNIKQHPLQYLEDECSFNMGLPIYQTEMELVINKICLSVNHNFIVDLGGFCGLDKEMISNVTIPEFKTGVLKVEHDLKMGIAWGINEEDWPVYVNTQTGWVCIGNPEKEGEAVEFINNCVAVIDNNQELASLWLKPLSLPNL